MAGDLPAKTNPHVEAWGLRRELVEHTFRWSPRTLALVGVFGVAVPYAIYHVTKADFVSPLLTRRAANVFLLL